MHKTIKLILHMFVLLLYHFYRLYCQNVFFSLKLLFLNNPVVLRLIKI